MKRILIIGAGFLQSFVIKRAKELGYFVLAVDGDSNAIGFQYADRIATINIVDMYACLDFARKENIDGVLTAATDYGVLTASYIARELNLPGLNYDVAKLIKNKYKVRKLLFENRVDDTSEAYEIAEDTDLGELEKRMSYPLMVKPCDGSGSRGASRVNNYDELRIACKKAISMSITHRAEIETFIVGREYGAESIVIDGKIHVLAIMQKWMTNPPYYAELGHAIPNDLSPELERKAIDCVTKALVSLGVNHGAVNMDLIITPDGKIHIIDVGARMGGNMIGPCVVTYGTGIDYIAALLSITVGINPILASTGKKIVATRLLAFDAGVLVKMPDFCEIEKEYGVEIYHHLKLGQIINEYHTNLDGCGYIVAKKNTISESIESCLAALKIIDSFIMRGK